MATRVANHNDDNLLHATRIHTDKGRKHRAKKRVARMERRKIGQYHRDEYGFEITEDKPKLS